MAYWGGGSKYHAHKTTVDGITFDSKREARRWQELQMLEKAGEISELALQPKFLLIPEQREPDIVGPKGGRKKGKLLERACYYIADFMYKEDGQVVVEDVKSEATKTAQYKIKRKLMLYTFGIRIREVE